MWLELTGAALFFILGSIAVAEWFALAKLNGYCERLERENDGLLRDNARMIKLYAKELEK